MKIRKIQILLFLLMLMSSIQAQVSENEFKAAFIERFTRFVEWPMEFNSESDTFKIVVIGETPIQKSLDELFENTNIKKLDVEIKYTNEIQDIKEANLVYISSSEKNRIAEILSFTNEYPILTISGSEGFGVKGIHINMYIEDNHIRYEINEESIKNSNLNVSSLLLNSAKIVETDE
ncbi:MULTISPECIES: YfiR family protein [unclassified Lentimicrobium]|uniref:YfiR family protein n=1 Tax=unclassified Lentimicrobium TaxID=2677434 RepID=UPI0015563FA8|nr:MULTISPECIES: YfiR family protein [unclassified Lentimicrobium]NPD45179.1 YfiR family protein [Lentimicrobium sp. S6]NPD84487.1 YfiR family protein [Lentimicrobium sp. L6]